MKIFTNTLKIILIILKSIPVTKEVHSHDYVRIYVIAWSVNILIM